MNSKYPQIAMKLNINEQYDGAWNTRGKKNPKSSFKNWGAQNTRGGGRKLREQIRYVFWFSLQLLSETFLILRRTELDVITNEYRSSIHFLSCSFQFLSILHKCRSLKIPSGKFFILKPFINSLQVPSFVSPFHISHLKLNESLYIPLTRSELPCLLATIVPSSHILNNILKRFVLH